MEKSKYQEIVILTEEECTRIQKAVNLFNNYRLGRDITRFSFEDILFDLLIFTKDRVETILELGTEEEIKEIILKATKEILAAAEKLESENKIREIAWAENRNKIYGEITNGNDLLKKVDYEYEQNKIAGKYLRDLKYLSEKLKRNITAMISTEEEVAVKEFEVRNAFSEFRAKVQHTELKKDLVEDVLEEVKKAESEAIEFIDVKFKEEPVRLLYFKSGNRVSVKVNLGKGRFSYRVGKRRCIRTNNGEDHAEYSLIVSVSYIMDFLYTNKVRDEDIVVSPESIEQFYEFDGNISVNLAPAFVAKWWNYDCPDIYRHSPNKYGHTNMLGMPICHFSHKLVESSWTAVYIGEDITEEEVTLLTKEREHTRIYSTMQSVLKARELKNKTEEIEALKEKVASFDQKVQQVIDTHKGEILAHIADAFGSRVLVKKVDESNPSQVTELHINDNFGLDCGFLNIFTANKDYSDNRTLLRQLDSNTMPWMNVDMPYNTQSLTVNRVQFDKVRDIVLNHAGIELYSSSMLD